jgi:hypothetical protein
VNYYNKDLANNLIGITHIKQKQDPQQIDDEIFKGYFVSCLAPQIKSEYNVVIEYGTYQHIIDQICDILKSISSKSPK